jgi:hypothetical protein
MSQIDSTHSELALAIKRVSQSDAYEEQLYVLYASEELQNRYFSLTVLLGEAFAGRRHTT